MQLRVVIIEPDEAMRESLAMFVESLGHEVVAATEPELCPQYHQEGQSCSQDNACCDALILGQQLPLMKGIRFLEKRAEGGCKGAVAHSAIFCRPWSEIERLRAKALGCRFFETPLKLADIDAWLGEVEANTPPDRKLAPVPMGG